MLVVVELALLVAEVIALAWFVSHGSWIGAAITVAALCLNIRFWMRLHTRNR